MVFKTTKDVTLRWFQYRIVHRILATNSFLTKIKILNNPLCTFCKQVEETLPHIFCECEYVERLWVMLENWIFTKTTVYINFSKQDILFGKIGKQNNVRNLIVLIVKHYIYKQRVKGDMLFIESVKKDIINYYNVEKYISSTKGKLNAFMQKWSLFVNLVEP